VGDIPPALQPKLLRVLQEQEFERLGRNRTHQVDIRLVTATNRNLTGGKAGRISQRPLLPSGCVSGPVATVACAPRGDSSGLRDNETVVSV
jgi:hypothetical protein